MKGLQRPFAVSEAWWTLLFLGLVASASIGAAAHGPGGGLIAAGPFVGIIFILAASPGETRLPDAAEAAAIHRAEELTGLKLPLSVRSPRTRRTWIDRTITGGGLALGLIVIGLAAL